jgi:hypothetical protein
VTIFMIEKQVGCVMHKRLQAASPAELNRLCEHLGLKKSANREQIEKAYLVAADNSIFNAIRNLVPNDAPTYSKVLRLIFKEMRPYSAALDETWKRVKSIKFWDYRSAIEDMDDEKLEEQILSMYAAEYADANDKLIADPNLWKKVTNMIPGLGGAAASAAVSVSAQTAARLPFTAVAPGAVAGPIGLGLAVILIGSQLAAPAYRKIIPATVELMLIGRRIDCMPEE